MTMEELLTEMLGELRQQTKALNLLVETNVQLLEALGDEGMAEDETPRTYLDGSPCLSDR